MLAFIKYIFVLLGVVFFCLLCYVGYLLYSGQVSTQTLLTSYQQVQSSTTISSTSPNEVDKVEDAHPYLSASQEAALRTVGISPEVLPNSLTTSQKECLIRAVGEARAKEIMAGSFPSPMEIYQGRSCLSM